MCPCSEVLLYKTVLGEVQKTLWAAQSCIVNEAAMDGAASWQPKSWLLSMVYYGGWYFFQHAIKLFSYMQMVYSNHATNTCVHVYVHTSLSSQTFSHFFGGWEMVWSDRLDFMHRGHFYFLLISDHLSIHAPHMNYCWAEWVRKLRLVIENSSII